jgi:4-amino-4-deoxy-L-arabinose transferase-like glycosyltransferase
MEYFFRSDRRHRAFLILIILLAFSLRLYHLDGQSMWWDEIKTWRRAIMPVGDMLADLIRKQGHLPLYFLLMRPWAAIGQNAFVLRFFSVIFGVLTVAEMYRFGRLAANRSIGTIAAFLLAVAPLHVWYSQEARMYTLLPFVLLVAHDFLLRAMRQGNMRHWLGYGVAMLVAFYTHYFTVFVLFAHCLYFILHLRQMRSAAVRWFLAAGGLGALAAIWVALVATISGYGDSVPGWINKIDWYDPLLTIWNFSAGFGLSPDNYLGYLLVILYGGGFLLSLRWLRRRSKNWRAARLLFLWFAVPFSLVTLISLDWNLPLQNNFSLYMDRYLLVVLPPFLLLTAWGSSTLTRQRKYWLAPAAIVVLLGTGLSQFNFHTQQDYQRRDWRSVFAQIEGASGENDLLVGRSNILLPLEYYQEDDRPFLEIPVPEGNSITPAYDRVMGDLWQDKQPAPNQVWLIETFSEHDPHNFPDAISLNAYSVERDWFGERLYRRQAWLFSGIRLTLYTLEGETG